MSLPLELPTEQLMVMAEDYDVDIGSEDLRAVIVKELV